MAVAITGQWNDYDALCLSLNTFILSIIISSIRVCLLELGDPDLNSEMTSRYAFSPSYQGLNFDYTKEKTLSTLVNLQMFWRIKINCYRLNTWGVSQMEINIALLEHRRQAWNWKATWILNHFRFPKPFYFKEHDLSKKNFSNSVILYKPKIHSSFP